MELDVFRMQHETTLQKNAITDGSLNNSEHIDILMNLEKD